MRKQQKNKLLMGMLIFIMVCTITGCDNSNSGPDNTALDNTQTEADNTQTETDNTQLDGSENGNENITNTICIDTGKYNAETDAQSFFSWGYIAQSKQGYYFNYGNVLLFYDFKSKQVVPVCNKPNCTHDSITSPDCNAVFSDYYMSYDIRSGIRYYEGYLYMTACDEDGYDCLYRISLDGSTREKYMRLYRSGKTETTTETIEGTSTQGYRRAPHFWIHRGYVYYINNMEKNPAIRRMKMGSEKEELVYKTQGERAALYRMKAYGDYLVFQTGNFEEDMIEIDAGLCAYNTKTGEIGTIVSGVYNEYHIYGDSVYYATATEIRRYDMKTKEDIAVIEGNDGYYSFGIDEEYVYTYNDKSTLKVYTHDGEEICCVIASEMQYLYNVNDGKILAKFKDGKLGIIETKDFADGKAEWTCY